MSKSKQKAPKKPAVTVTAREAEELLKATERGGFAGQTAKIILLVATGVSKLGAALELGLDRRAVFRTCRDWNERRLRSLSMSSRAARTVIDPEKLIQLLRSPPPDGRAEWTLSELASRLGVGHTALSKMLTQRGIPWK